MIDYANNGMAAPEPWKSNYVFIMCDDVLDLVMAIRLGGC